MWSSRLSWKLFLSFAGLVLLVVCACVAIVSGWQEEQLIDQVRRRLHDSAALLRNDVQAADLGFYLPTARRAKCWASSQTESKNEVSWK